MTPVAFAVPLSDNDHVPYPDHVYDRLEEHVETTFGGWSRWLQSGGWTNPETGRSYREPSYRYEVAVPPGRIGELLDWLRDLGRDMGQETMYAVAYGDGRAFLMPSTPKKGEGE